MTSDGRSDASLRAGDLIPDHALTEREPDEFKHTEIAERVAELVTTADPPLNVALFGSWGSGKSSFATLLRKALAQRSMKTKLVVYDAWKYSGEALQRTFIAEAAEQLGIEDEYFTSQLAQTVERAQLDLKQSSKEQRDALLRWVWRLVVPVVAAAVGIIIAAIALVSYLSNRSVGRELLGHAWLWVPPLIVAVVAALLKLIVDTAKLKMSEGPPSEEGFEKRFKALLKQAAEDGGYARFIFFIDELDRIAPRDVVRALGVIKNFLGQKNAVFIVAADKQVLERAFTKLPQATPTNEDDPYYSSASEFLDKIFQHQLALPPLRGSSLFRFAHDLVAERRGGLWAELKATEPNDALLDGVLYVLIPSHVRSPRRVKVLLNNFATNARIAQARGINWVERAKEIAKLTVLQTEFPLFAADLDLEPRLPRLVLDSSGYVLSERTRRLLERHGIAGAGEAPQIPAPATSDATAPPTAGAVPPSAAPAEGEEADVAGAGATDTLLVPTADQPKLVSVQRENLRRYLTRTEDVPNPSRELLFLEPGGAAEGLGDPELGELLEAEAVDNPSAVLDAARGRTKEEQQAIVRVLATMSEQAYAEERSNIITALLDVVRLLDLDLGPSLAAAAGAVNAFLRTQQLQERQLVGALRVGIAVARSTGDTTLRDAVLNDERLLTSEHRVRAVASLLDDLPQAAAQRTQSAVGEFLDDTSDVLTEPLKTISPKAASELIQATGSALQTILKAATDDDAEVLIADLFDVLDDRVSDAPEARVQLMWNLLLAATGPAYHGVQEHAAAALSSAGTSQRSNSVALKALALAPASDWELWLSWLDEAAPDYNKQKEWGEAALTRIAVLLPSADEDQLRTAQELALRVTTVARLADEDISSPLTAAVQGALQTIAWWGGGGDFLRQEKIHQVVRTLGDAIGSNTSVSWADLRYADLIRGVSTAGMTVIVLNALATWTVELKAEQLRDLATRLSAVPASGDATTDTELMAARTQVWIEGSAAGESVNEAPYSVSIGQIVAAAKTPTERAQQIIVAWFGRGRITEETAEKIIRQLDRSPTSGEADEFRDWFAGRATGELRTQFLIALAGAGGSSLDWLRAAVEVTPRPFDEDVVAHAISSEVMQAPRAEERREAVDALLALSPQSAAGQAVVGQLIIWLLGRNQKVDFDIALVAVGALGSNHGMGRKVGDAFRKACDQQARKIPASEKATFDRARVVIAQSYFERPRKKGLKGLFGR
jgi:hypothetical protein